MINQDTLDNIGRNAKYCFTKAGQCFLLWAVFLYLFGCIMAGPLGPRNFMGWLHYASRYTPERTPVVRAYDGR
jgi:hypothetical protein